VEKNDKDYKTEIGQRAKNALLAGLFFFFSFFRTKRGGENRSIQLPPILFLAAFIRVRKKKVEK